MYFYELVNKCDKNIIAQKFIEEKERYNETFDKNEVTKNVERCICNLREMDVVLNKKWTISVYEVPAEDDLLETYDEVTAFCEDDEVGYSLVAIQWNEALGFLVDDKSIANYELNELVALILWELTWFGYEEPMSEVEKTSVINRDI